MGCVDEMVRKLCTRGHKFKSWVRIKCFFCIAQALWFPVWVLGLMIQGLWNQDKRGFHEQYIVKMK